MRIFRYFYFRLYNYYKNSPSPFFSTSMAIIVFTIFNLFTLAGLLLSVIGNLKIVIPTGDGVTRLVPLIFIVPIYGIFYFFIKRKGYHDIIMEEFRNETANKKFLSSLFVIIYFIISVSLFVLTLWLRRKFRGY
jgi:hypothetical protein